MATRTVKNAPNVAEKQTIDALDSAAFNAKNYTQEWLVEEILVRHQPGVLGGPKKSLKTSIMVDLAVSIGSGTPFLGHFDVHKRRTVAVFSGESGGPALQYTARRVAASKDISLDDCRVHWCLQLPLLHDSNHRRALRDFIRANMIEVVFIDPLYLCLVGGTRPVSASNLYEVGPLLLRAAQTCLQAGATPIFVHHATKSANKRNADGESPPDLDDLAFAGIGEFARQWLLIQRRSPYSSPSHPHELTLAAGGSAGQSGCWQLQVDEGLMGDDFNGRTWEVTFSKPTSLPIRKAQ